MELRPLTPDMIPLVLDLAKRGIYDTSEPIPFLAAWDQEERIDLLSPAYYYSAWTNARPERWTCMFTVLVEGEIVGMQDLMSPTDFRITQRLETGSWLGRAFQGRGYGTLMRQMIAAFAVDELGALEMLSAYLEGNESSAAVSRKVGYVANGLKAVNVHGQRRMEYSVRLTPETLTRPADPVVVENADEFRTFFDIELLRV